MSIHQATPPVDSLVLYKVRPARVVSVGDKIEIELDGGQSKRVRPKDIELLHPGPLRNLDELGPQAGELTEAWELLEGGETNLKDLTELAFNDFTPATAWAAWQLVAEGLNFSGTPQAIQAHAREVVEHKLAERASKEAAERDWQAFLDRMAKARPGPEDVERLGEIERLALNRSEHSRILEALGYQQTQENAHRALVRVGHWPTSFNPHPLRQGILMDDPALEVPALPDEERLDLTHLTAFAIDDEGSCDPDDALALDDGRLWVHVADVAAVVEPESPLEAEARARGANLYLPEGIINMLPAGVTERLGLGLQDVSPALSFALRVDTEGVLSGIELHRTWVRVERLTYAQAEERLMAGDPILSEMAAISERFQARRRANGASRLDLPEVSLKVEDDSVRIRPLPRLKSRDLVTDAMLMAGEAAARLCIDHQIPIPFATQAPPESGEEASDLAAMYSRRRCFKPTKLSLTPDLHASLGLPLYTRATSPLRRYSDLLVHQQLRAWLAGRSLLDEQQVLSRIGEADTASLAIRRGERLSNQHWKLVFLRDNPDWKGEGVVVGIDERKTVVLVPELAMEARVRVRDEVSLNQRLRLAVNEVDLPGLSASFRTLGVA
ncbi:RNB domain-containing ribonuclease [Thiorhodococcus mannitoliphagus]|uniref:RNB domain-containing ribonuclease n=1 Tax=Thiorhodococcus mannitoliphagus TaxID=329406 RepID=A0A6P1DY68_9GAMM|nr:RNB domain-containing ribonuclease [Thiorhodococcus mannitoliphagus]NEX21666.1 RNB domain-containing ribonuclease [Thiorhodococcus mannitoliphagus]